MPKILEAEIPNDDSSILRLCLCSKKMLENGQGSFGLLFHLLSGFHKLYSEALLKAAFNKLLKSSRLK